MYVCICNAVTDSDIREAVEDGVQTMKQLRKKTACGSNCGCCNNLAAEILNEALQSHCEKTEFLTIMQPA